MTYADEIFYNEKYLLGRKPVVTTGFPFYARQASQVIDQYTFGRLVGVEDIPEEVQMCCCELVEAKFEREQQQKASGGKTSEKIGTYSATFGSAKEMDSVAASKQHGIIMKWLGNTGLCYRGVGC